jgi:hypothetical protein
VISRSRKRGQGCTEKGQSQDTQLCRPSSYDAWCKATSHSTPGTPTNLQLTCYRFENITAIAARATTIFPERVQLEARNERIRQCGSCRPLHRPLLCYNSPLFCTEMKAKSSRMLHFLAASDMGKGLRDGGFETPK